MRRLWLLLPFTLCGCDPATLAGAATLMGGATAAYMATRDKIPQGVIPQSQGDFWMDIGKLVGGVIVAWSLAHKAGKDSKDAD